MNVVVGASLSEPHTSVTALHTRVSIYLSIYLSMDWPLTINFKLVHSNISRGLSVHALLWERAWRATQPTARLQGLRESGAKTIPAKCIGSTLNNLLSQLWPYNGLMFACDKAGCEWQSDSRLQVHAPGMTAHTRHSMNFPASSWFDCESLAHARVAAIVVCLDE